MPQDWLQRGRHIDADIRGAFAGSDSEPVMPGGWYRNQFWFVPGPSGDILLGLGIYGKHWDELGRRLEVSSMSGIPHLRTRRFC